MTKFRAKTYLAIFTALAATTGAATLAWACTAQSRIAVTQIAPDVVRANGAGFPATPVELRWHEVDGPVVGRATGPEFSVDVAVPPDAAPGLYYLVAVGGLDDHAQPAKATDVVRVPASSGSNAVHQEVISADLWQGFSPSGSAEPGSFSAPVGPGGPSVALVAGLGLVGISMTVAALFLVGARRTAHARRLP